jgi:hypothetical protein
MSPKLLRLVYYLVQLARENPRDKNFESIIHGLTLESTESLICAWKEEGKAGEARREGEVGAGQRGGYRGRGGKEGGGSGRGRGGDGGGRGAGRGRGEGWTSTRGRGPDKEGGWKDRREGKGTREEQARRELGQEGSKQGERKEGGESLHSLFLFYQKTLPELNTFISENSVDGTENSKKTEEDFFAAVFEYLRETQEKKDNTS